MHYIIMYRSMIRVTCSGLRLDPSLLDECVKLMDWAMLMEGMDWAQFMNLTHSHPRRQHFKNSSLAETIP